MPPRMGHAKYDAFEAIYAREQPRVFRYALARTRDHDVALDIVSEAFKEAWIYRVTLFRRDADGQRAYLLTIARGRISAHWRKKRALPFSQLFAVIPEDETLLLAEDGGIEAMIEACDLVLLRTALRACTPTQIQIIQLRYIQNLPAHEVAARLGLPRAVYRVRHDLLMQHLATVLGGVDGFLR